MGQLGPEELRHLFKMTDSPVEAQMLWTRILLKETKKGDRADPCSNQKTSVLFGFAFPTFYSRVPNEILFEKSKWVPMQTFIKPID